MILINILSHSLANLELDKGKSLHISVSSAYFMQIVVKNKNSNFK